ncbi:catalase family protein [Chryseobacterium salviniae]|uniref:Catalase n=1 Tax=Chryseobacterium salviniae TaxID=3101750 RepID=A0ABU6HTB8_9FLAO|nr:catalase [Chryseobacterium sp. T9W2-O]MEC3875335.1 catalase [Chryseobacterium sp. T9W2-O]
MFNTMLTELPKVGVIIGFKKLMPYPLKYNKDYDKLTDEERALFEINKKSISDFVEQSASLSDVNYATRNAHAKTYAVAKGRLIISEEIPQELQQFFDKEFYDLTIRMSNAHLKITKSKKNIPAYGFAVKIKDERGDLIANYPLVNFPLFPINSVSTFLKLFTSINQFYVKKWSSFSLIAQIAKVIPSACTPSFIKNIIKLWRKKNDFILSFDFHSVGVYRIGDYMMKIKLSPQSADRRFNKNKMMKEAVEDYLKLNPFTADVYIQLCYNLKNQPVNQLNVMWKNSPYIKIGELRIEKKDVLDPASCGNELLSFNPYESKAFFQPVGKIQKLREEAYKVSLKTRVKINKLLKYNK